MSTSSRLRLGFAAALATVAVAAVALGQDVVPVQLHTTVKATPDQAGTPRHPRGVALTVRGTVDLPGQRVPLLPSSVDAWLPKGWRYNGAELPACARAALVRHGPSACPPRSIVGHPNLTTMDNPDDLSPPPRVTVINGGQTKMYLWVEIRYPARVGAAVTGTITKLDASRWSYRIHAEIPSVLDVVSGIPTVLGSFRARVGHGDWIATTGCPRDHRWRYHLRLTYASGQVADTGGSTTCRS